MFVSEAHSVTLQARLAITLAWVAGYTNAVALLACHSAVSHMTGATSNLGIAFAESDWSMVGLCAVLLGTFVLGAGLTAAAIEFAKIRNWQSIYVGPMILQAALLTGFALCLEFIPPGELLHSTGFFVALGLAAGAMGIQNSAITSISRGVVRTTHVTGVLTDIGYEAVQLLVRRSSAAARLATIGDGGHELSVRRLALLGSIVGSFAVGAALGTIGYERFPQYSMFPPVLFLFWIIVQDLIRPIASVSPAAISAEGGVALPPSCAYFVVTPNMQRPQGRQRIPNLAMLVARQPAAVTTIVVDLSVLAPLDESVLRELRLLSQKFRREGKELRYVVPSSASPEASEAHAGPFYANLSDAVKGTA